MDQQQPTPRTGLLRRSPDPALIDAAACVRRIKCRTVHWLHVRHPRIHTRLEWLHCLYYVTMLVPMGPVGKWVAAPLLIYTVAQIVSSKEDK